MRFGVKKYPTLQYFHAGQVEVYTGARDLDSMVHFLDHMVRLQRARGSSELFDRTIARAFEVGRGRAPFTANGSQ